MAAITIDSINIGTSDGYVPLSSYSNFNRACIGSRVKLAVRYILSGNIPDTSPQVSFEVAGSEFYFNPAMFLFPGQKWFPPGTFPQSSYYTRVLTNTAATYNMVLQGTGSAFQSEVNGVVTLSVVDATTIDIEYEFMMTCDTFGYITGRQVDVSDRLASAAAFQPEQFDNSIVSVYNSTRSFGFILAAVKPSITVMAEGFQDVTAAFWNSQVGNDFGGYSILYRSSNSALDLGSLSRYENQELEIRLNNPNDIDIDVIRLVCWEVGNVLNGDWENSVGLVDFEVQNTVGTAPLGGIFTEPSSVVKDTVNDRYVIKVQTDYTLIDPSKSYYIAILAGYESSSNEFVVAFTTEQATPVEALPPIFDIEVRSYFANYAQVSADIPNDFSNNLASGLCDSERVENGILINVADYNQKQQAAGYGNGFPSDFLQFDMIVRSLSDPSIVLYEATRSRLPLGNFPTNDKLFSYENIGDELLIKWRERIPGYTESDLRIDWTDSVPLNLVSIDFFLIFPYTEFTVRYRYRQVIIPEKAASYTDLPIDVINGSNGLPAVNLCDEDFVIARVREHSDTISDGEDYNLIAIIDSEPFGNQFATNAQNKEHESFAGAAPFVGQPVFEQLESEPIFDCDTQFQSVAGSTERYAFFKIDCSQLQEGVRYVIKTIQIKVS